MKTLTLDRIAAIGYTPHYLVGNGSDTDDDIGNAAPEDLAVDGKAAVRYNSHNMYRRG
jgi:hypothetical protein